MLQGIDEKTQHRKLFGHRLEIGLIGLGAGGRKVLDLGAAAGERLQRAVVAQDGQGAINLVQGVVQGSKTGAAVRGAEEGV